MADVVIELAETTELDLQTVNVDVAGGVIAFDVAGAIRGLDESVLDDISDASLTPTEIHFSVDEDPSR